MRTRVFAALTCGLLVMALSFGGLLIPERIPLSGRGVRGQPGARTP